MKTVLMVQGSLRKESFNRQLMAAIQEALGSEVELKELSYEDLPLMNQDIEWPTPQPVQRVREEVKVADGLWVVSPQYNASYPGHVKNLIDWLSRPVAQGDSTTVAKSKKVTFSGIAGRTAAAEMREKLGSLLSFVGMDVMSAMGEGFVVNGSAWSDNVVVLDDVQKASIKAQAEQFLRFIEA